MTGHWVGIGIANDRAFIAWRTMPRAFAAPKKEVMASSNEDEIDRERAKALASVDSRVANRRFRPRMSMLEDEQPSRFELGADLDAFIDPDERSSKP